MSKGGSARRFYGNYEYVIKLRDLWNPSKTNASVRRGDADYYFKKAIGWSQVGNAQKTFRSVENSVCGTATPTIYLKDTKLYNYVLAFLNTKIAYEYLVAYNPTINLLTTDICNLPLIIREELISKLDAMINECIEFEKIDWDSFETSWDFQHHPLLRKVPTIAEAFDQWKAECDNRFNQLKANEEELNRIFIDIYGLQDELTPEVEDKDVIRNYFLSNFYSDHCKIYQKRPIYWLFDSGKKNGFKALIYMHRYQPNTIARIRTDYVHEQQARYRTAIADLEQRIANASTGGRVKLNKKLTTLQAQDTETRSYEEKIHHLADQMISIDLDDGVKKNYAIFQDVLAKIK